MSWLHAVVLGIVEGVTEFLPISSTGHLILASHALRLPQTEFLKSFEVAIQLGAIAAVCGIYARDVLRNPGTIWRIATAFIPTAIIGFTLYPFVKHVLLGNETVVIWALGVGGILILLFERFHHERINAAESVGAISYQQAFLIGCFQALAVVPGVSRAAATILGGLALGVRRRAIVEFSFLLAIPTMAAATGLDLLKTGATFSGGEWGLLAIGFVTALVSALAAVRWLLRYIERHDFTKFGWYRIAVSAVFLAFFL